MIYDSTFLEKTEIKERIASYNFKTRMLVKAGEIIERPFYIYETHYSEFYSVKKFTEIFEGLKIVAMPELTISIESSSEETNEIKLSFNSHPFTYKKDDSRYSDDLFCSKLNQFL